MEWKENVDVGKSSDLSTSVEEGKGDDDDGDLSISTVVKRSWKE